MNFRNIYATLLCVVAIGLTSCSNELNNAETTALNPNENAAREVTVSASKDATTRSIVGINAKAEWEKGDLILTYNLTNPQGFDQLHARDAGVYSKFDGSIQCKVGDDLAFFYPYQDESKSTTPGTLELNMQENTIEKDGVAVTKVQDGTRETLNHFDYTWGTLKNINFDGPTLLQDIDFSKQYSILKLDFKYEGLALKNIKKLTIKGITTKATFDLKTGKFTNRVNDGLTIV
ncbi:MAG: fimbrillin family protein, partial [Prevotella pallens]|nr:fimbrillin family protein [Prevotella pallens]